MIQKNYKKVAIKKLNIPLATREGSFKQRIQTNFNFTPSMVFVTFFNSLNGIDNTFGPNINEMYDGYSFYGKIEAITKEYVDVDILVEYPQHGGRSKLTQILAIE